MTRNPESIDLPRYRRGSDAERARILIELVESGNWFLYFALSANNPGAKQWTSRYKGLDAAERSCVKFEYQAAKREAKRRGRKLAASGTVVTIGKRWKLPTYAVWEIGHEARG